MGKDNQDELLPLVDEYGNVIGRATRKECHGPGRPLHPVVHLHVFDRTGRLYLQKRPMWKDIQPGRMDTSVGGHVDFGESISDALRREAREEFGLDNFVAEPLGSYIFECERERELINAFRTTVDSDPRPSDELDGGCYMSLEEIEAGIGTGIFTPNFEMEFRRLFRDGRGSQSC